MHLFPVGWLCYFLPCQTVDYCLFLQVRSEDGTDSEQDPAPPCVNSGHKYGKYFLDVEVTVWELVGMVMLKSPNIPG